MDPIIIGKMHDFNNLLRLLTFENKIYLLKKVPELRF